MKQIFLCLVLCASVTSFAQKKLTCKKGSVKQNDQLIAQYDGVGSMFKMVKLGVFAPGSKDTLFSITEENFDPKNPLFPDLEVVYKVEFKNNSQSPFYVHDPKNTSVRYMERDVMEMVFNDSVPPMISEGKLDEAAVEAFRTKYAYNYAETRKFIKDVEDSIAIMNQTEIVRDRSKPISFKIVNDNSNQFEVNQVSEIYQDGVLLGRMVKKVSPGQFSKASYTFWKKITPVTINGIDMKHTPVAYCITGSTPFDIPIISVIGKNEYKIKGTYNALEIQIVNVLVQNKLL